MSTAKRPRGCRDFGPEEMRIRRGVEKRMREAIERFGYREISTPTFEHTELFVARSGPQVLEQMYTFEDKGGRSLSLRPELTAPVMRFFANDLRNEPKPLRIYYFGNCFRYERPQKGRFREFWQMGLEYIGKRTPLANAEVVAAAVQSLNNAHLRDFPLRVGDVKKLKSILSNYGLDAEKDRDLMTSIDKKEVQAVSRYLERAGVDDPDSLTDLLTDLRSTDEIDQALEELSERTGGEEKEAVSELGKIFKTVGKTTEEIYLDPSISRGLDYYDGAVFEIDASNLGAEKQICGGGAYSLSSVIGKGVEGIGFGLGFDRIVLAMEGQGQSDETRREISFYLLPMGEKAEREAILISSGIRDEGFTCHIGTSGRGFKKSIKYALSMGCTHLAIVGERELEKGVISVKDLETGTQEEIPPEEIGDRLG